MNVRQKLSLAALCLTLPVMASAQAAAEPPAFSFKPYGFLALTYAQQDGTFKYPEYASVIASEEGKSAVFSARQSRIGWNMANADAGYLGAKSLSARLEFDFMGAGASWDSALPRFRYAYAKADWAAGPGTFSLTAGQTDGLVNPLHPELGAHLALPTFMQSGNLTRRSPQLRAGFALNAGMVAVSVEAAALSPAGAYAYDATSKFATNNGMIAGMPDLEARVQAVVKPMADVTATVGVAYHKSKLSYDNTAPADGETDEDVDASVIGVDVNVDATKYLNVRGEFFTGEGTDATYTGAFGATTGTAGSREANETSGFWAQATIKPIPQAWIIAGYGSTTQKGVGAADDTTLTMLNVGLLSPVSKNWRLGLEYTSTTADNGTADISGSEIALSSRFSF